MKYLMLAYALLVAEYAHASETQELEAYIGELVNLEVISDTELMAFKDQLEMGNLTNPIDCKKTHCDSVRTLHESVLEQFLSSEIHIKELHTWVCHFLVQRGHDVVKREEAQGETKDLWKSIPSRLAVGPLKACAVSKDRKAICWRPEPEKKAERKHFENIDEVAVGHYEECVRDTSGKVHCSRAWDATDNTPEIQNPIVQISAGTQHTCILDNGGTVKCWGTNTSGQCDVPTRLKPALQVSAGEYQTCALQIDRTVDCWGANDGHLPVPSNLAPIVQVSSGGDHNCVLDIHGKVICWGGNSFRQLNIPDLGYVLQISANAMFTCALEDTGTIKCWGPVPQILNEKLAELGSFVEMASSRRHVCGVLKSGKVKCLSLYETFGKFTLADEHMTAPEDLEVLTD